MPGANWYRDGTVTATEGSKAVLGSGTIWSVQAKTGDLFALLSDGGIVKFYEIDTVTDNTHLTLKDEFAETTAEAAEYAIVRNFNTTMTSETNAQLVSFLREWKLALQNNLKGDQGDPGADGNTIYSNNGGPAAGLGVDDDWCIDYSTWNMYRKESGTWTLRGNIKGETGTAGAAGAKWYSSASDPSSAVGITGDYALNTTTGDVFKRGAGGWTLEGNLKGATGSTGAQGPQGATGATGTTGTAGSRWHTVTGVPSTALGVNTDMALDTATGNWYQKESGAWGLKGNIKGPTGATGAQGIPGATWKGEWSSATEYAARDVVYYNGNSYIAIQTGTNQTPPATSDSYWQIVARKGTDGEGAGDMLKIDYDSDADGKVNAAVAADTATYATTAGRATAADSADSVAWEDVSSKPSDFTPSAHALDAHTAVTLAELSAIVSDKDIASTDAATTSAAGLVELATNAATQTGTSTTSAVTPAGLKAYTEWRPSGMKNLIINGNASRLINQRGIQNGDVFTPVGWRYTFDQWRMACDCASVEFIKEPDAAGLRILDATGGTYFHPFQRMLEMDEDLGGRTFTLTMDFLSNSGTGAAGYINFHSGANGTGTTLSQSLSIAFNSPGTRKKASVTATAPSGARSIAIASIAGCADGNYVKYYNIQLEEGSVATPFEQRPIGLELALCQRYFQKRAMYVGVTPSSMRIDMRAAPTITGGGTGFSSTGTTADTLICSQTTGAVQALEMTVEL